MLGGGDHADYAVVVDAFEGELEVAGQGQAGCVAGGLGHGSGGVVGKADEGAGAQGGAADGHDLAIDQDVAVADQLACRRDAACEAEAEDDVVQAQFQEGDEGFNPVGGVHAACGADEAAQLLFAEAVVEEELLLFTELDCVLGQLAAGCGLAVLAGREVSLFEGSGLAESGKLEPEGALHLEFGSVAHLYTSVCRSQFRTGASPKDRPFGTLVVEIRLLWS